MRILRERIDEARKARSISPLMTFLHDNMRAASRQSPRDLIACGKGCSHCCYVWVSARAPEVLLVKNALPARERAAIQEAIDRACSITASMNFDERSNQPNPCPLLKDNICQVYGSRPTTCQSAASTDSAICERSYRHLAGEDIPIPLFYVTLRSGYSLALAGALKHAGFPATAYEFNTALQVAMSRSDAETAWLSGEDVFAGVPCDPVGDPFTIHGNRQLYDAAFG